MNIVVVDDEKEIREVIAELLVEAGYAVALAASGEEALPLLAANFNVDLLITDVRMPGMSGFELAATARKQNSRLRVIMISGYHQLQQSSDRMISKPFKMSSLLAAVLAETP